MAHGGWWHSELFSYFLLPLFLTYTCRLSFQLGPRLRHGVIGCLSFGMYISISILTYAAILCPLPLHPPNVLRQADSDTQVTLEGPSRTISRNQICHARSKQTSLRIRPSTSSKKNLTVQKQTGRMHHRFVQSWRTLTSVVLCSGTNLQPLSSLHSSSGLLSSPAVQLLHSSARDVSMNDL